MRFKSVWMAGKTVSILPEKTRTELAKGFEFSLRVADPGAPGIEAAVFARVDRNYAVVFAQGLAQEDNARIGKNHSYIVANLRTGGLLI